MQELSTFPHRLMPDSSPTRSEWLEGAMGKAFRVCGGARPVCEEQNWASWKYSQPPDEATDDEAVKASRSTA